MARRLTSVVMTSSVHHSLGPATREVPRRGIQQSIPGFKKGRFPPSLPHAQLENKWEKRRYLCVDATISLFEAASFCVIHV
jgi:hypothetical protein